MSYLFDRQAVVSFGRRGQSGTQASGLRVVFDIVKDSNSSSNKAKITLFNLNRRQQAAISEPNSVIVLDVGYRGDLDQLFSGDITNATTGRAGADWVTIIEAGDGQVALDTAHIDKAYAAGTHYKTIARDVINTFRQAGETAVQTTYDSLKNQMDKTQTGMSLSGKSADIMDDIMSRLGLEWSIQDNRVQVLRPDQDSGEEAVVLTPHTGLILSPVRMAEKTEVTALIQSTRIRPGRLVQVESRDLSGVFRVQTARYNGDTHGMPWYVTCEVTEK